MFCYRCVADDFIVRECLMFRRSQPVPAPATHHRGDVICAGSLVGLSFFVGLYPEVRGHEMRKPLFRTAFSRRIVRDANIHVAMQDAQHAATVVRALRNGEKIEVNAATPPFVRARANCPPKSARLRKRAYDFASEAHYPWV